MKTYLKLRPLAAGMALAGCPWLCMAASFTVDSAADAGPGSLRAVLAEANATGGEPHDIHFDLPPATTIVLTSGELAVTRSVNFHGPGAEDLIVSGSQQSRIFNIESDVTLVATISGMTLTNGHVDDSLYGQSGAGIRAHGNYVRVEVVDSVISSNENVNNSGGGVALLLGAELDCQDSVISGNSAGPVSAGGGIYSSNGDISLTRCQVTDNEAGSGGGIRLRIGHLAMEESLVSGNTGGLASGGIELEGYVSYFFGGYPASAEIIESLVTANNTGGSGGCISGYFADIEIRDSVISLCEAEFDGGGILVQGSTYPFVLYGDLSIVNSEVRDNQAGREGGGVHGRTANIRISDGSRIDDNESAYYAGGLALRNDTWFEITDTVISGNKAQVVSALWATEQRADSAVRASRIANNEALVVGTVMLDGGAFTEITDTLISNNVAQDGLAGLFVSEQVIGLFNSTIANNQSISGKSGFGHALSIGLSSEATVQHVTIAFNDSGGLSPTSSPAVQIGPDVQVAFDNTLIALNSNASGETQFSQISRHDTATVSGRHNLLSHLPVDLFNGTDLNNQVETSPGIKALTDNGGRSRTVALQPDSPAVDTGIWLLGFEFDQRGPGFPRIYGDDPDIGAFEFGPMDLGDEIFSDRFEPNVP